MDDVRQAVYQSLQEVGIELLQAPSRFVGQVSDRVEVNSYEMTLLRHCCDLQFLDNFRSAADMRTPGALQTAYARSVDHLTQTYASDDSAARSACAQVALGLADYLGIPAPAELLSGAVTLAGAAAVVAPVFDDTMAVRGDAMRAVSDAPRGPCRPSSQMTTPASMPGWSSSHPSALASAPQTAPARARVPLYLALVALALVALGLAVAVLLPRGTGTAALHRYAIKAAINVAGLDAEGSRVPVCVTGTTADGQTISEHSYIDSDGYGLKLLPGTYTVTLDASPVAKDGTLYRPSEFTLTLEVPKGQGRDAVYEVPDDATITLEPMPVDEVSQAYLDEAFSWLRKDNERAALAEHLVDAAQGAYDTYQRSRTTDSAADEPSTTAPTEGPTEEQQAIASLDGYWLRMGDLPQYATRLIEIRDGVCTITSQDGSVETIAINSAAHWPAGTVSLVPDQECWYFPDLGRALIVNGSSGGPGNLAEVDADGSNMRDLGWWFQSDELPSWYRG